MTTSYSAEAARGSTQSVRCASVSHVPAWTPTAPYLNRSRLKAFAEAHGHRDYASLLRWSQTDLEGFWRAVDRDIDLVWAKKYDRVYDDSKGAPWTTWWRGGRMNYVATALRPRRAIPSGVPQRRQPPPGAARPQRREHLAVERRQVEPAATVGLPVGVTVLQAQ